MVNDLGGGAYSTEGGWALNEPKAGGTTSSSTQSLKEYRWDERNRLQYSNDERYGVRYAYGEDGERTGKWATSHAGGESETLYFGKLWNWHYDGMAGDYTGMNSAHVFLGDTRIATKAVYADGSFIEHAQKERQYYYHSDHLGSAQLITDYNGDEYERIEYTPYGELWIEKAAAASALDVAYRFTGKELDRETGLYYYGARYFDPRESRWLSVDPAMGEYVPAPGQDAGKLPGMGGVFNTVNLHVYHYAGNNPVKYTDPDGQTTEIDEATGEVMNVIDDKSTAIIAYSYSSDGTRQEGTGNYIGESFQWNSFEKGSTIHVGEDKTADVYATVKPEGESNITTAIKSLPGGEYDIKTSWKLNPGDEYKFEEKYASVRDMGNILAGINAKVGGTRFVDFQRMAGAVEATNGMAKWVKIFAVCLAALGIRFGPPPRYGENQIQYNASRYGYDYSYGNYSYWRKLKSK